MKEDLDLELADENDTASLYPGFIYETTFNGKKFYLVDGDLQAELHLESKSQFEDFLDDALDNSWGYADDFQICDSCGTAINVEDMYEHDYWWTEDGVIYCGDCVRNDEAIRDYYIEFLTNNPSECNTLLGRSDLIDAGLKELDVYEDGYYGRRDEPKKILHDLLARYPNGKFVFDLDRHIGYYTVYRVWAFPGYGIGEINDEEE